MSIAQRAKSLRASRNSASIRTFLPSATVKCEGPAIFRSQAARDAACLFDLNPSITSWHCMPQALDFGHGIHIPDFGIVDQYETRTLIDASDRILPVETPALQVAAAENGYRYRRLITDEVYDGPFLENARDLLRYGNSVLALGDRLRVTGVLEEEGSLTVKDCLAVFTETKPIAGLAQLILHGFVEIDLDSELLGPHTTVRRMSR